MLNGARPLNSLRQTNENTKEVESSSPNRRFTLSFTLNIQFPSRMHLYWCATTGFLGNIAQVSAGRHGAQQKRESNVFVLLAAYIYLMLHKHQSVPYLVPSEIQLTQCKA